MSLQDVIIRHPKERLSKCSLEPLRGRDDFVFHTARAGFSFDATGYILLSVNAPVLSEGDADPRVSKLSQDPSSGLASVEALYCARLLQGRPTHGLLDHYHWKDTFLRQFQES
jgi:pre-rRNA-processing protein TSR3